MTFLKSKFSTALTSTAPPTPSPAHSQQVTVSSISGRSKLSSQELVEYLITTTINLLAAYSFPLPSSHSGKAVCLLAKVNPSSCTLDLTLPSDFPGTSLHQLYILPCPNIANSLLTSSFPVAFKYAKNFY